MKDLIVAAVIIAIVAMSIYKIVSEKRKGSKCVGCAASKGCTGYKKAAK